MKKKQKHTASPPKSKVKPAAKRSEDSRYKDIFNNAIEGVFQSTLEGKLLIANPAFISMLGYDSFTDLRKHTLTDIYSNPFDRSVLTGQLMRQGFVKNFEQKLKRKDGTEIMVIENSRLVKDRKGTLRYIEGMILDITGRKEIEERLLSAEKKFQSIFENAVEGIYQSTPDGQLITANAAFLSILGYGSVQEIQKSELSHLLYVDPRARQVFRDIIEREGKITEHEVQLRRKDGVVITALLNSRAVKDEKGNTLYYEGMLQDITRRKAQEEQLRVLNAQKDKFLGIISHDLRAPFNSILGFSELLLDEANPLPDEEQKEFVRFIHEAAKQQLQLLTNLLDWSRFETGRMRFAFRPVSLSDIVGKCVMTLFGNARKKQISLVSDVPPPSLVRGDEYLLLQLFTNLISNALKFTPPNGSIRVEVLGADALFLTVAVKDTGVGIPEEDRDKLFRIESKHSTRGTEGEEGSGLGLVLCQEIVQRHRGTIRVESEPGKGTSFIFTLPLPKQSVLVVEDDKADRLLTVRYLEQSYPEVSVLEATNGEEALALAIQHLPTVIIADFIMPAMDGISMMRELQKNAIIKNIPVVSMTSVQSQGSVHELRSAGAVEVLMKPFSKVELCAVMDKFLK